MNGTQKIAAAIIMALVFAIGMFSGSYLTLNEIQVQPEKSQTGLQLLGGKETSASIDIVAVQQGQEIGVLSTGIVQIKNGEGRVLFNTNPFVEPDTQQSLELAAQVAQEFTGKSLADKDVIYSISESQAKLVGGPSAGGAFAVATVAAIEEKKIKEGVVMTGTIEADGSIGQIGGVLEKGRAAGEAGKKLFLVPVGQSNIVYYEQQVQEETRGNMVVRRINYVPKQLDVNAYLSEQYGLEVREVKNLSEAVQLMVEQ